MEVSGVLLGFSLYRKTFLRGVHLPFKECCDGIL